MKVVVVGSGASGAHFALSALRRGHHVVTLDVGLERPPPVHPDADFHELKDRLDDPLEYFLGRDLEGFVEPGSRATFYGFPPSKKHVFDRPQAFSVRSEGMRPYFSFARGGLAEAWTAGVYPFTDAELEDFPFDYAELRPAYAEVARRIGISARRDDLERFIPLDFEYMDPLEADPHSRHLLETYARRRDRLNRRGWYMGRSRVATLSRDRGERRGCDHLGRCFWGCPNDSIYSPTVTLAECMAHPRFEYRNGRYVTHFEYAGDGTVGSMRASPLGGGPSEAVDADLFVLAAGALMSSKIVLDSVYRRSGEIVELEGLMDNRQVHVPFLTLSMIGRAMDVAAYQYHHIAFGLESERAKEYVHGQITTLKAASIHPIVQTLPVDLRTGVALFRALRTGLAVANVNLHDSRRPASRLTIQPIEAGSRTRLVIDYRSSDDEPARMRAAVKRIKRCLRTLGAFVPPGLTRVLPKGTSAHYAGTLPMSVTPGPFRCAPDGTMYDFPNLCVADAATFPFLPAKNHTLTLMANAVRLADRLL